MKSSKFLQLALLLSLLFSFQACSDEDELIPEIDPDLNDSDQIFKLRDAGNDLIHDWTALLLEIEKDATGMRPNASARALAYIYLASYETAVPAMRNRQSNSRRFQSFSIDNNLSRSSIHWGLAINTSLARTLAHFLINVPNAATAQIAALQLEYATQFSQSLSATIIDQSIAWGNHVADRVIAFSQTDQAAEDQINEPQPTSYEPPVGDGFWTYSAEPERALFPYWGSVRTFVISPEQTTTVAPIPYNEDPNSVYFAEMQEVYEINNAARAEDGEQLWIAEFWSDDVEGLTFSPPARQFSIANQLIQNFDLNLEEALGLYLKLGFSLNDAAVATWKYKYEYMVMRPNVFIHEFIDPNFQTNLYRLVYWPNPSFPGYPSGHSCFASAAAGVFKNQFGNQLNFTDFSHQGREGFRSTPRSFNSFDEMAVENAFSRIPLGVHIRMDCAEGLRLGYEISAAVNRFDLRD